MELSHQVVVYSNQREHAYQARNKATDFVASCGNGYKTVPGLDSKVALVGAHLSKPAQTTVEVVIETDVVVGRRIGDQVRRVLAIVGLKEGENQLLLPPYKRFTPLDRSSIKTISLQVVRYSLC